MKKLIFPLFISLAFFFIFSTTQVSAKVLTSENGNVDVYHDEVIDDDLFVGAQTANIEGTVNGDVFVGAQTAKITGVINGNLHVGANTLYLGGIIKGNVYAGGQSILVNNGQIGGSLLVGGATVDIDKNSSIGGSVFAGAGALSINSLIKRNVFAGTGSLVVGNEAKIGKDLYYATGDKISQVNISSGATIDGAIHKSVVKTTQKRIEPKKENMVAAWAEIRLFSKIISFLSALIVGYIFLKLFKNDFLKTSELVTRSFWKNLGIGFLLTIALIPGLIIMLITVVGIPIAGLVLLLFSLYTYLAKIVVGASFGGWMTKRFNWKLSTYWTFALGLLAIYILKVIPLVGFTTDLVVAWSGIGAFATRLLAKK